MRLYEAVNDYYDFVLFVVADNAKEAKQIVWDSGEFDDMDWLELKVTWYKHADIVGLKKGIVSDVEGFERKFYQYIDDYICPVCGKKTTVYNDYIVACMDCIDASMIGANDEEK